MKILNIPFYISKNHITPFCIRIKKDMFIHSELAETYDISVELSSNEKELMKRTNLNGYSSTGKCNKFGIGRFDDHHFSYINL